jgi:hypothetical protein
MFQHIMLNSYHVSNGKEQSTIDILDLETVLQVPFIMQKEDKQSRI